MIRYEMARDWIAYDRTVIVDELIGAKSAMMALTGIPYQRSCPREPSLRDPCLSLLPAALRG